MTDSPTYRVGRRVFLRIAGGTATGILFPWGAGGCSSIPEHREFFDGRQWRTLEAAMALLVPESENAHAVAYVDALMSAFEHDPPRIFAGGPYSGRYPFGDPATGQPSDHFPPDDFSTFLPLSPVHELAWRIRLYGSANVEGGDFNDAVLGPVQGWRDLYQQGLAKLDMVARDMNGSGFAKAPPNVQDAALTAASSMVSGFHDTLLQHTLEGTYGDPVYGGNEDRVGWTTTGWDGDSQPLGHAIWTHNGYVDVAARPTSMPDPGPSEPFSRQTLLTLDLVVAGTGGQRF